MEGRPERRLRGRGSSRKGGAVHEVGWGGEEVRVSSVGEGPGRAHYDPVLETHVGR